MVKPTQTIKVFESPQKMIAGESVTVISEYESLMFTRSWHGVGDFQIVINHHSRGANELQKGRIIALNKSKVGIIKHRDIRLDENGKASENWTIRGWELKGLLRQRLTLPPSHTSHDRITDNAESVMLHYVNNNVIDTDPRRQLGLILSGSQNRGKRMTWESRFKILSEELEKIGQASGLGWTINTEYEFKVLEGLNLSVNQSENSPVYFSPEFGNVKTQSFSDSDLNMHNVGYVGGQGEGTERLIVELGEASGVDRIETFIDARDVGDEDMPESEQRELLEERGDQRLAEMSNELYFEAEIMNPVTKTTYENEFETFAHHAQPVYNREKKTELVAPFRYEIDYDLGDIVTIMNRKWGVIVDRRITEFTEIHEPGGFQLEAVFGQKRPDIISKMKDEFKQYEGELKR